MPIKKQIQIRRDTAADWLAVNPTLEDGEPGYEIDTDKLKIGDGLLSWALLPYFTTGALPPDLSSYATITDLTNHTGNVGNPHSVTKAQVGLGSVPDTDFTSAVAANTAKISFDNTSSSKLAGIASGAQVNTVTSVAGKTGAISLDSSDVGLGNVNNTADSAKPVSIAQGIAISGKADTTTLTAHTSNTSNPHSVTKAQVGLGSVPDTDFTSAIAGKQDTLVSGTNIKTINSTSLLGSGNITISGGGGTWGSITGTLSSQTDLNSALTGKEDVSNKDTTTTLGTSDTKYPSQKAVKTYVDTANVLKANIASPTFTGTVVLPSSQIITSPVLNTGVSGTAIDTDGTLAANSDTKLASQKAIKTYSGLYVNSKAGGLVTNGSGLYGNNTNFTGYTYLATDKPTGASGSFKTPNTSQNLGTTDEFMAVDPLQRYRYSFSAKQISGSGNFYGSVVPYDVDKLQITPSTYMVQTGTLTTLAVELKAGDTTMTLTNATNWYNGGGGSYLRRAIFWNYTDSTGYTWPAETYSRNNTGYDFWNSGGISGNVVTLKTTYAGVTVPVGTAVSNGSDGGTYMYIGATNVAGPASWTSYSGDFGGAINPNTTAASVYLPISTAYIKAGLLYNMSGSSSYQAFANINIKLIPLISSQVPSSASATGVAGQTAYASGYFYVCTDTNTWKRVAVATW